MEARLLRIPFYHAARGCVCCCGCGPVGNAEALSIMSTALTPAVASRQTAIGERSDFQPETDHSGPAARVHFSSPASGKTPALRQVRERTLRASQLCHTEAPAIDALALHRACSRSPRTTRFSVELGRSCRPPGGVPLRAPLTDLLAFPLAITRKPPPLITRNDNKPMRGGRRK